MPALTHYYPLPTTATYHPSPTTPHPPPTTHHPLRTTHYALSTTHYPLLRDVVGAPEDSELRRRLKCICSLANPADIKVDKVTHRLVARHDAEPYAEPLPSP